MNSAIMVMLFVADKPKTQYVTVPRSVLDKVLRDIKKIADRAVNPGDGYAYALGKCNGQARPTTNVTGGRSDMQLLTLPQAAERLGLKLSTIRFWVWQRKIETVHVGRAVRVREETIQELIQRGTVPARRD